MTVGGSICVGNYYTQDFTCKALDIYEDATRLHAKRSESFSLPEKVTLPKLLSSAAIFTQLFTDQQLVSLMC
ncbi:hypothetical protein EON65_42160 [archaeon]|nr:MAG: hypothetical protein EON65_42160 [archaeon]